MMSGVPNGKSYPKNQGIEGIEYLSFFHFSVTTLPAPLVVGPTFLLVFLLLLFFLLFIFLARFISSVHECIEHTDCQYSVCNVKFFCTSRLEFLGLSLITWLKGIPEAYYVWLFKKPLAKFLLRGCVRKEGRISETQSCGIWWMVTRGKEAFCEISRRLI